MIEDKNEGVYSGVSTEEGKSGIDGDQQIVSIEEGKNSDVSVNGEEKASQQESFFNAVLPAVFSGGCDYYGLGLISPLLPYFIEGTLDAEKAWIGYITTAQYIGVLLGSLTWGRVADRIGIKKAIQIALAGDVVFFLLTGFCYDVVTLAICRLLAGFFTPLVASISWVITSSRGDPAGTYTTYMYVILYMP